MKECFLINEIGCIFWETKDSGERQKAEEVLSDMLTSKSWRKKLLTFCYLSIVPTISENTAQRLRNFGADPQNKEILEEAERQIQALQQDVAATA